VRFLPKATNGFRQKTHFSSRHPELKEYDMIRRLLCFTFLLVLTTASFAAETRTITDMAGRTVTIPTTINRIYAVGHCLPMVSAVAPEKVLNAFRLSAMAKRFIAADSYQGKVVPQGGHRFSDEEIVNLRPEIVIMEALPYNLDQAERLQNKIGAPVVLLNQDMMHYPQAFAFLGDLLGQQEQAQRMTAFVNRYLYPLQKQAQQIPLEQRVRVYYAENPDGLSTNPAGSIHTQLLEFVGGINVAEVINMPGEGMSQVSMEQLILWQPDLILVWTPSAGTLRTYNAIVHNPLWNRLRAVTGGKVYQIPWLPYSWFDRPPGSNRIIGAIWLADLLYPERFNLDTVAIVQEYFRIFYRYEICAADARLLLSPTPAPQLLEGP